jgi:hypothetical protein
MLSYFINFQKEVAILCIMPGHLNHLLQQHPQQQITPGLQTLNCSHLNTVDPKILAIHLI